MFYSIIRPTICTSFTANKVKNSDGTTNNLFSYIDNEVMDDSTYIEMNHASTRTVYAAFGFSGVSIPEGRKIVKIVYNVRLFCSNSAVRLTSPGTASSLGSYSNFTFLSTTQDGVNEWTEEALNNNIFNIETSDTLKRNYARISNFFIEIYIDEPEYTYITEWKTPGTIAQGSSSGIVWASLSNISEEDGNVATGGGTLAGDSSISSVAFIGGTGTSYSFIPKIVLNKGELSFVNYGSHFETGGRYLDSESINSSSFGVNFQLANRTVNLSQYTYNILCTNFGFNIPQGSIATGIEIKIKACQAADNYNQLIDVLYLRVFYKLEDSSYNGFMAMSAL